MGTKIMARKPGEFIIMEGLSRYSRDVFTVLSGQVLKCGQVCRTSGGKKTSIAATGNEVHTYTPDANPTSGSYRLTLWHYLGYWVQTGDIAYNASTTTIATAINAVLGTSAVAVGGGALSAGAFTVTFSGTKYASLTQPLGQMDVSLLAVTKTVTPTRTTSAGAARNEVQTVDFGAAATGGTVKIGVHLPQSGLDPTLWPVVWTDTAAWNTTDATFLAAIQAVLDQVCGANGIVVSAKAATDTDIALVFTFSGTGFAGIAHPFLDIDTSALTSVTSSTWTRTTAGGLDGANTTVGNAADSICLEDVDASGGDVTNIPFLVRDAIVDGTALYYGGGDPTACIAGLKAVGIVAELQSANFSPGV